MIKSKEKRVAARNRVAVGKEPFRVKFGMTGDFPCEKEVLQVLQVLVKKETTIKI